MEPAQKKLTNTDRYNAACARVRDLLRNWLESGIELFLELRNVEKSSIWKIGGHATFSEFLKSEFPNAIGFNHYQGVMRAIDVHGIDFVKNLGVHASLAASCKAVVEYPERVQRLQVEVERHVKEKKAPPEVHDVRRMLRVIAPETATARKKTHKPPPPPRPSPPPPRPPPPKHLEPPTSRVEELKARIKELETRVRQLEDELKRYKPTKPPGPRRTW